MGEQQAKDRRFQTSNILIGLLMICVAILAMISPEITNGIVIVLLSMALLISGLGRLINSLSEAKFKNLDTNTKFFSGLIAIVISIAVIIITINDFNFALEVWYFLLAGGLLIIGLARLIIGIMLKESEKWYKIFVILVGGITIILSILIFVIPDLGEIFIVAMISISLIVNGITRIILGIKGPE